MVENVLIAVLVILFAAIALFLYCFGWTDKPEPKMEMLISLLRKVRHAPQGRRA